MPKVQFSILPHSFERLLRCLCSQRTCLIQHSRVILVKLHHLFGLLVLLLPQL